MRSLFRLKVTHSLPAGDMFCVYNYQHIPVKNIALQKLP